MKRNTIIYLIGSGVVAIIVLLAIASAWIGFTVADTCQRAEKNYTIDDCTTALITLVSDETQPFAERNDAIWALGQYGDRRALPVLQQLYTGQLPDREPWNETLSQYELQKAIHLLEGGFNITVIFRALTLGRAQG